MYQKNIKLPIDDYYLEGLLSLPVRAKSIIIFTHGHGQDRYLKINRHIALYLQQAGYGTLLFDLLAPHKDNFDQVINNFELLSQRLSSLVLWLFSHAEYTQLRRGLFASGRGVQIALKTAVALDSKLDTLVCAGGHPESVRDELNQLTIPSFFLFGERDQIGKKMNKIVQKEGSDSKRMVIIPGTSSLFEEPGKLEVLTKYSLKWFHNHMPASQPEQSLAGPILDDDAIIAK